MKTLSTLLIIALCSPVVSARLTDDDLYRIKEATREIIKEELKSINQRIDDTNKRIDDTRYFIMILTGLIAAVILVPSYLLHRLYTKANKQIDTGTKYLNAIRNYAKDVKSYSQDLKSALEDLKNATGEIKAGAMKLINLLETGTQTRKS